LIWSATEPVFLGRSALQVRASRQGDQLPCVNYRLAINTAITRLINTGTTE
jgi:hypothetical protein